MEDHSLLSRVLSTPFRFPPKRRDYITGGPGCDRTLHSGVVVHLVIWLDVKYNANSVAFVSGT
jgi:hypothetical protein